MDRETQYEQEPRVTAAKLRPPTRFPARPRAGRGQPPGPETAKRTAARPAPRAWRTAISRRCAVALTIRRLATFAHAISSTSKTAPSRLSMAGRSVPTSSSRNGLSSTPTLRLVAGYAAARRAETVCRSALASVQPNTRAQPASNLDRVPHAGCACLLVQQRQRQPDLSF